MTTFNSLHSNSLSDLIGRLHAFDEAGIDPTFDSECEELERKFAELRCQFGNG